MSEEIKMTMMIEMGEKATAVPFLLTKEQIVEVLGLCSTMSNENIEEFLAECAKKRKEGSA